jgi:dihydrofolate reductase
MRRVRYGGAISLDGFIAGPNGEADWIPADPDIDFAAMFAQYDTLLIGRKTYEQMLKMEGAGGEMPGIDVYVFSSTLKAEDHPTVRLIPNGAADVVRDLKAKPGKDIALFGGGELFRSLHEAGLVDTVEVALVPVLLGGGVPLMGGGPCRVPLRLKSSKSLKTTGIQMLEYEIVR